MKEKVKDMSVPVLVEAVNGQFAASLVGTPSMSFIKPTRTEAIEALKTDLAQRIRYGELVLVELNAISGVTALAGKYANDATLNDIVEEAYQLRDEELAALERGYDETGT